MMEQDIQTYVVHCDKHKERLLNIENHIKNIIPNYSVWKGIIPYYEDIDEDTPYMSIEKMVKNYDDNINLNKNYNFKTLGQIGCYLSHITLMRHIKNNAQNSIYTIILEDDANLTGDFNQKIKSILDDFDDFDMLYLGTSSETFGTRMHNQLYVYNFNDVCINGTYAYVVKNSSAEKIYNLLLDIKETIDGTYSRLIHTCAIKAFVVRPFLANYDRTTFYSTIDNKDITCNSIIKKNNSKRKLHVVDKIIKCMNIIVNNWLIRDERSIKNSQKFKHVISSNQKRNNNINHTKRVNYANHAKRTNSTRPTNNSNTIVINRQSNKIPARLARLETSTVNHTNSPNPEINKKKSSFMKKVKNKRSNKGNFKYVKKENKDEKIQEIIIKDKTFTIHGINSIKKDNNAQTIKITIMTNKKRGRNPYVKK